MTDSKPLPEMTRLRHELLRMTDRAVGAEAEVDGLRATTTRQREEIVRFTAERDRLAKQLEAVHTSTTWRVGRALVAPAAFVRGRRRR